MADARRISPADQALLHLAAYLALETARDATWEAFRAELADLLPRVNRGVPVIDRLAGLAAKLAAPQNRGSMLSDCERIKREITEYHKAKAASAIAALRQEGAAG